MSHPLDGCFAKIERAKEQITNLNNEISALLNSSAHELVVENQVERQRYAATLKGAPICPLRLSVIAGEVVHHLRSVLDHLIWALALKKHPNATWKIQFPICTTTAKFEKALRDGIVQGIPGAAVDVIRRMQPYQSADPPNAFVQIIHELDTTDKHKLLAVVVAAISPSNVLELMDSGGLHMNFTLASAKTGNPWHMAIEDGNEVQWFPYTPRNPNLKMKANFGVHVAFEKVGTLERKPVIPLLVECLNYIEAVVGEFARVFWPPLPKGVPGSDGATGDGSAGAHPGSLQVDFKSR